MPNLAEEIRRAAIAKLLQEKMQPSVKYDVNNMLQGYSDEVARDVPSDYSMPWYETALNPNWGKKYAEDMKKYPMKTTKNVPLYTDVNIHKTETPVDFSDPKKLAEYSAIVSGQGGKPEDYGLPSFGEAAELPSKIAKNQRQEPHYFKSLDHVPAIMTQFGLSYNEDMSPIDNWNSAIKQVDPQTKATMMEAFKKGTKEKGQYSESKDLAGLDQKVEGMVAKSVGLKFGKDAIVYDPMTESWQFPPNFQGDRKAVIDYADTVRSQYQQRYGVKPVGEEGQKQTGRNIAPAVGYLKGATSREHAIKLIRELHQKGWTPEELNNIARDAGWE